MRKLLFFIPVLLCTFGCRGWHTIVPDVDTVDSVVYNDYIKHIRCVITDPDTIKEIGNLLNCDSERGFLFAAPPLFERLSFYYKDTVITISTGGGNYFRGEDRFWYELPYNIDDLFKKYFKKQQKH